jgi:ABC-2 type transport system permease protein
MSAFASHFSFEFRTGLRDRPLLLMNYLFPLSFYVVVSLLMTQLNPTFRPSIIPTMVVFVTLTSLILGLPNPLVSAREAGIFRSYRVNGVPALSVILVPAITTAVHTLIAALLVTFTAPVLFHTPLPVNWGGFVLFLVLTVFVMAGFGVLIGVISTSTRITILWSQLIFLPSIIIGGLMVPRSALTGVLAKIGSLMPSTYSVQIYDTLARGAGLDAKAILSVVVLIAGGVLAFSLASYLFSWDSQNTTRRGSAWLALAVAVPFVIGMVLL